MYVPVCQYFKMVTLSMQNWYNPGAVSPSQKGPGEISWACDQYWSMEVRANSKPFMKLCLVSQPVMPIGRCQYNMFRVQDNCTICLSLRTDTQITFSLHFTPLGIRLFSLVAQPGTFLVLETIILGYFSTHC